MWLRWIWIVIALSVSTSAYFVIRYGLRPKPIPVMNATEFSDPEQIGVVIYKRLRDNFRAERLILLGSSTQNGHSDREVWAGLVKAAAADGEKIQEFNAEELQSDAQLKDLIGQLQLGKLVVVHGATPETSHLVESSLSKRLEPLVRHPVLAISALSLAVEPEEMDQIQMQCLDAKQSDSQVQKLDCAAQKVARKFLKRRLSPEKLWAVMERHGLKEYLVFIHRPPKS